MIVEQAHRWPERRRTGARLYATLMENAYRNLLHEGLPDGMNALVARLSAAELRLSKDRATGI